MSQDSHFDILFEPVKIGPVTAPNRFYQVPHCNGMGHLRPRSLAAMRGVKAEGGWGVICTEEVEIHPSSDVAPSAEGRIWSDADIEPLRWMTDAVHEHGALAGIELVHSGANSSNLESRLPPLSPSGGPVLSVQPCNTRAMTRRDIRELRVWHRDAAIRAKRAGFDIIYVYAAHNLSVLMHFMLPRYNQRSDEYGGSLENRVRLTREILEDTRDAVGDTCAIALRFAVEELMGEHGMRADGEARDIVGMLAELPDLWDVNISNWANDSATARFEPVEGYQNRYTGFVKSMTTKPVVGVGRFTSPDEMVRLVRSGAMDLIGAARPSIADPFLPNKIRESRVEDIRECIGCNICVSSDNQVVPMRCTQNPTVGEEWRRAWHPERIAAKARDEAVLVVGGGPSGLECALQLANRGYQVSLAEADKVLGGRLRCESRLPGLGSYMRVREYRVNQLLQRSNAEIYLNSDMDADAVLEFGAPNVFVATGSKWRRDGTGRSRHLKIPGIDSIDVMTPEDDFEYEFESRRVVIYDDEHYYVGGAIAERLADSGADVTLVTPESLVSAWTVFTLEQKRIQKRLLEKNVRLLPSHGIHAVNDGEVITECVFTGREQTIPGDTLVLVTTRDPVDTLLQELKALDSPQKPGNIFAIGDCLAPGTVANAVYLGHLAARHLHQPDTDAESLVREWPEGARLQHGK